MGRIKIFILLALTEVQVDCCMKPAPQQGSCTPTTSPSPCVSYANGGCSREWIMAHRPCLRFDGGAEDKCYPDEAIESNEGQCKKFNAEAPIYYDTQTCGHYMKIVWWFWYGKQTGCTPADSGHGNDWEHITINFKRLDYFSPWEQDSVTWFQHNGWYTRKNTDRNPNVYVGKTAHGSYDNWCDGVGAVWEQDYCAGGCGYWDDFRNDRSGRIWMPHNAKDVFSLRSFTKVENLDKPKREQYFDDSMKNKCKGGNWRCVAGSCGCWRNDHTFPVPVDKICHKEYCIK